MTKPSVYRAEQKDGFSFVAELPRKYALDALDRMPGEDGFEADLRHDKASGPVVAVLCSRDALEWLRGDAAHYAHPLGPDACPPDLLASAKRAHARFVASPTPK